MPFNKSERNIKKEMQKKYGKERGERIFYASATAGKLGKDIQKRHGSQYRSER